MDDQNLPEPQDNNPQDVNPNPNDSQEDASGNPASAPEQPTGLLDAGDDAGNDAETVVDGAPEAYEPFTDEDGQTYAPEALEGFVGVARELGLSQEKAQKMFGSFVPTAKAFLQKDLIQKAKGWAESVEKDSELGGANFKQNLGIANQAYRKYASPEMQQILKTSGLSAHPEVVRMFYRIGKTMQQDHGVQGGASAPATPRRRYPNSNMVVDE